MAAPPSAYKDRQFIAVIGDEVSFICPTRLSVTDFSRILLRDCSSQVLAYELRYSSNTTYRTNHHQHVTQPPDSQKNFLVVDSKTDNAAIEEAFERFTTERKDIGILLINQHVRLLPLPQAHYWYSERLLSEYVIESTHTQLPFQLYWRFRAKTIHMIRTRTASWGGLEDFLESRWISERALYHFECEVCRTFGLSELGRLRKYTIACFVDGLSYDSRTDSVVHIVS